MHRPIFIEAQNSMKPLRSAATTGRTLSVLSKMRNRLRAKFTYGKRHRAEYVTGLILLNGHTFLFGNGALGCLNEILSRTHNANDREDA